ncbi:MAG: ribosome small subunit-dependent GTPase A [Deltaproteobacteria bacterium]|nr:ribosome small subunit-dependent GTPase A [Deltaproteobacteria bacterium]
MADPTQGLVVRSTAGFVDVRIDGDVVQARMRGRLKNTPRTTDLCVIGDQVMVSRPDKLSFVVVEVLPRASRFSRMQPGRGPRKEDVLVANLEQLMITFCHGRPPLNRRLLDRFLVIAEHQCIQPVVVMNKSDLREPGDADWQKTYESIGYPVLSVSAATGAGMGELAGALLGKISAFVGPSGVGKSSLINRILPDLELKIASVSDHHGKGRPESESSAPGPCPSSTSINASPSSRYTAHNVPSGVAATRTNHDAQWSTR